VQLEGFRILVAEDNATNRLIVKKMLVARGAALTLACNGQEAVQAYVRQPFDLVLMDLSMPVMTGLEATREMRRLEAEYRWHRCVVLAMTGNAFDSDRDEAMAAGMDGFLTKPLRMQHLLEEIRTHLQPGAATAAQ
jgi:CheY-like chemotaxis protein